MKHFVVFSWAFKLRVIMMEQLRKQYLYFCAFLSKVLHVWSLIYNIENYKVTEIEWNEICIEQVTQN